MLLLALHICSSDLMIEFEFQIAGKGENENTRAEQAADGRSKDNGEPK